MKHAITIYVKPETYEQVLGQIGHNWAFGGVVCGLLAPAGLYYWRRFRQLSNLV